MSIRADPTFQDLLEIRDSLLHLLDRRIEGPPKILAPPQLNEAIRIRIKDLGANALCSAGTDSSFEEDLYMLDYKDSGFGCILNRGIRDCSPNLRKGFGAIWTLWWSGLKSRLCKKGEGAMLNNFPLKQVLRK